MSFPLPLLFVHRLVFALRSLSIWYPSASFSGCTFSEFKSVPSHLLHYSCLYLRLPFCSMWSTVQCPSFEQHFREYFAWQQLYIWDAADRFEWADLVNQVVIACLPSPAACQKHKVSVNRKKRKAPMSPLLPLFSLPSIRPLNSLVRPWVWAPVATSKDAVI